MTPREVLGRWHQSATALLPPDTAVWDAHAHTGQNDPDQVRITAPELLDRLDAAGHAGAVVTTSRDPDGYRGANDRVLAEAEAADGRLIPFLRVDPNAPDAQAEVDRCLAAGHRGIKLHPRGESFRMGAPAVRAIAAVAADRGVPLLVHSGRGIPSLATDVLELIDGMPGLRVVLAHCAISDLSRLGPVAADHPGLYFDTSWWDITDLLALFAWVPPGRILYASDTPYGMPVMSFTLAMRAAAAAGARADAMRAIFGATLLRLVAGDDGPQVGPAPGDGFLQADAGLLRVHASLHGAIVSTFAGSDASEPMSLARAAAQVVADVPHKQVYAAVAATLAVLEQVTEGGRKQLAPLLVAAAASLTPNVPVPDLSTDS